MALRAIAILATVMHIVGRSLAITRALAVVLFLGRHGLACVSLMQLGSVGYASLAWAHTWHEEEPVVTKIPSRVVEYYDHLIGKWGER